MAGQRDRVRRPADRAGELLDEIVTWLGRQVETVGPIRAESEVLP
jgi:hypothetical protein